MHCSPHYVFGRLWLRGLIREDLAQIFAPSGSFLTAPAEGDVSHRHSFSKTTYVSHIIIALLCCNCQFSKESPRILQDRHYLALSHLVSLSFSSRGLLIEAGFSVGTGLPPEGLWQSATEQTTGQNLLLWSWFGRTSESCSQAERTSFLGHREEGRKAGGF